MRVHIFTILMASIILMSCKPLKNHNENGLLVCILNTYINTFQFSLGKEISIVESKEWTDTTSIVSILSLSNKRLENGTYWYAKYSDAKVYVLKETQSISKIMKGLDWNTIEIYNPPLDPDFISPPEQFDEIQIIYNPSRNCIEESEMMGRDGFKEQLKTQCGFCK